MTKFENTKDIIFSEPWQAELFAITLNLHQRGIFEWDDWTECLGKNLKRGKNKHKDDLANYFTNWLYALEEKLIEKKVAELKKIKNIENAWRDAISKTPHGKKVEISPRIVNSILEV